MPLQMVSLSTGNQTRYNISTENILCGLRNKIKAYLHKAKKTGYLLLKQDTEGFIKNHDQLKLIPYKIDIYYTPFGYIIMISYEIELPPEGKKICLNFMDDNEFTTPYIIETINNLTTYHQFPTQDNKNVWIISINREDPITTKGETDKLEQHQAQSRNSKVNISLCRKNIYQRTGIK